MFNEEIEAGLEIALESKGWTPVFQNPAMKVSGLIVVNPASLKREETKIWSLPDQDFFNHIAMTC